MPDEKRCGVPAQRGVIENERHDAMHERPDRMLSYKKEDYGGNGERYTEAGGSKWHEERKFATPANDGHQ